MCGSRYYNVASYLRPATRIRRINKRPGLITGERGGLIYFGVRDFISSRGPSGVRPVGARRRTPPKRELSIAAASKARLSSRGEEYRIARFDPEVGLEVSRVNPPRAETNLFTPTGPTYTPATRVPGGPVRLLIKGLHGGERKTGMREGAKALRSFLDRGQSLPLSPSRVPLPSLRPPFVPSWRHGTSFGPR